MSAQNAAASLFLRLKHNGDCVPVRRFNFRLLGFFFFFGKKSVLLHLSKNFDNWSLGQIRLTCFLPPSLSLVRCRWSRVKCTWSHQRLFLKKTKICVYSRTKVYKMCPRKVCEDLKFSGKKGRERWAALERTQTKQQLTAIDGVLPPFCNCSLIKRMCESRFSFLNLERRFWNQVWKRQQLQRNVNNCVLQTTKFQKWQRNASVHVHDWQRTQIFSIGSWSWIANASRISTEGYWCRKNTASIWSSWNNEGCDWEKQSAGENSKIEQLLNGDSIDSHFAGTCMQLLFHCQTQFVWMKWNENFVNTLKLLALAVFSEKVTLGKILEKQQCVENT